MKTKKTFFGRPEVIEFVKELRDMDRPEVTRADIREITSRFFKEHGAKKLVKLFEKTREYDTNHPDHKYRVHISATIENYYYDYFTRSVERQYTFELVKVEDGKSHEGYIHIVCGGNITHATHKAVKALEETPAVFLGRPRGRPVIVDEKLPPVTITFVN